ncbi:MAG TPA: penicillin-binding protein 2, partial [bacterium]|nr:penicillin-binding protein 2 [bacterium]
MEVEKRLFGNIIKAAILIIILRCFYLQVVRAGYYHMLSLKNCIRTVETGTPRGFIYDRNKRVLARDTPSLQLVFIPYDIEDAEHEASILSRIVNLDRNTTLKKFTAKYSNPFNRIILKKKLTTEEVSLIEENASRLRGIFVQEGIIREYPLGKKTAHMLGYTGEISEEQLSSYKERGYKSGDVIGQDGIEKIYDGYIRGTPGGIQVEVDARGYHRKILGKRQSIPGSDLILTVDQTIQEIAEEELGSRHGSIVIMDPRNGQVLALVSKPAFDTDNLKDYFSKSGHPFLNRAIKGQYSPGSVFKIITAISALETGNIAEYDRVECTGSIHVADREFNCWKEDGHGWVDINFALPFSCNVFFGTIGMRTGVSKMVEFAKMFELGKPTGIDLPGEKAGSLPDRSTTDSLNLSIGQGPILVTPIQLASLISTVANGGNIWKPYIVKEIISSQGKTIKAFSPSIRTTVFVSSETMDIVKKGLKNVMVFGTGASSRVEGVEIAGKTGTVQRGRSELELGTHGFFVCYAPADDPKMAVVVFLDRASGPAATNIAGRIIRKVLIQEEEEPSEIP